MAVSDYFNDKPKIEPKFVIQKKEDVNFHASCADFGSLNYPTYEPISISIKFNKQSPTVILKTLDSNREEIELKYSSAKEKLIALGKMNFEVNPSTGEILFKFAKSEIKNEEYIASDEFKKCNSLGKLSSKSNCFTYFQKIEKQYFHN